ncbi:MAG: hypothetical protein K9K38_15985, partial [Rhodoferax sp.]|nr:hypothetical protein [Rhodoferax sp.]
VRGWLRFQTSLKNAKHPPLTLTLSPLGRGNKIPHHFESHPLGVGFSVLRKIGAIAEKAAYD